MRSAFPPYSRIFCLWCFSGASAATGYPGALDEKALTLVIFGASGISPFPPTAERKNTMLFAPLFECLPNSKR